MIIFAGCFRTTFGEVFINKCWITARGTNLVWEWLSGRSGDKNGLTRMAEIFGALRLQRDHRSPIIIN